MYQIANLLFYTCICSFSNMYKHYLIKSLFLFNALPFHLKHIPLNSLLCLQTFSFMYRPRQSYFSHSYAFFVPFMVYIYIYPQIYYFFHCFILLYVCYFLSHSHTYICIIYSQTLFFFCLKAHSLCFCPCVYMHVCVHMCL